MKNLSTPVKIAACAVLLIVMMVLLAPVISRAMGTLAASKGVAVSAANESAETGKSIPFLADLAASNYYGFFAYKTVNGQDGSYRMEVACTADDGDYVMKTVQYDHEYRQIYQDGQYLLVDDTAQTVQEDILRFDFLDSNLIGAIDGKIIRRSGELLDGNQVERIELYKDGTVYAYYINQKGVLVRFFYIYDGNEVTMDFERFLIGGSCCATFDIPPTYRIF